MAAKNESPFQTAFTVSIEAREGVTTGISAHDRAQTIQVAIDPRSKPEDLVQPGHIFPLKAKQGGVLERATSHSVPEFAQQHLFAPLGIAAFVDQPRLPEDLQVLGDGRLADRELRADLTGAELVVCQEPEDLPTPRRGYCFEDSDVLIAHTLI